MAILTFKTLNAYEGSASRMVSWEDDNYKYHVWLNKEGMPYGNVHKKNKITGEHTNKMDITKAANSGLYDQIKQMVALGAIEQADKAYEEAETEKALVTRRQIAQRNRERALRFLTIIGVDSLDPVFVKVAEATLETLEKWEEEGAF